MSERIYLVWSNEHGAWWRTHAHGYTLHLKEAGRFTRKEAISYSKARDWRPGERLPELPVLEDDVKEVGHRPMSPQQQDIEP